MIADDKECRAMIDKISEFRKANDTLLMACVTCLRSDLIRKSAYGLILKRAYREAIGKEYTK